MTKMERTAALPLEDADLFRERALIGGAWVEAASGAQVAVTDPATGATLGHVPDVAAARDAGGDRGGGGGLRPLAAADPRRARRPARGLVRR